MHQVRQDFTARVSEIEHYFQFVQATDDGSVLLMKPGASEHAYSTTGKDDLVRTFKGGLFLMLYNLMEATVKNVVEAIFEELGRERISFDACRKEIRRVVIRNLKTCADADHLKRHNDADVVELFVTFATDAVVKTFQRDNIVSGNVDAQEIRGLATKYGFDKPAADGGHLVTVKSNRNDLAHGDKSFAEVGRDFDLGRLEEIKMKVVLW